MEKIKKALVTGSSRGIGRAAAITLAQNGFYIYVHSSTAGSEKANETLGKIRATGGTGEIVSANLCDTAQTGMLAKKCADADVLVLNASVQIREKWYDITEEECEKQINCNFVSSLILIQAVTEHMQKEKWGRIITVGSVQEKKPHPDMLVYSASKAAQSNMVQSLALQLAPFGITVNNVAPGVIYTDRNIKALSDEAYADQVKQSIPLGFYGQPEDISGIIELLVSDGGRYITGQNIFVDGGKSII